jgi:transposase
MRLLIKKKYFETGVLLEHNHNILPLSPYHPELNQIELTWATVTNLLLKTIPHLEW